MTDEELIEFWETVRRALLMIARWIERYIERKKQH